MLSPSFDFAKDDNLEIVFVFFFAGAQDWWSKSPSFFSRE